MKNSLGGGIEELGCGLFWLKFSVDVESNANLRYNCRKFCK